MAVLWQWRFNWSTVAGLFGASILYADIFFHISRCCIRSSGRFAWLHMEELSIISFSSDLSQQMVFVDFILSPVGLCLLLPGHLYNDPFTLWWFHLAMEHIWRPIWIDDFPSHKDYLDVFIMDFPWPPTTKKSFPIFSMANLKIYFKITMGYFHGIFHRATLKSPMAVQRSAAPPRLRALRLGQGGRTALQLAQKAWIPAKLAKLGGSGMGNPMKSPISILKYSFAIMIWGRSGNGSG